MPRFLGKKIPILFKHFQTFTMKKIVGFILSLCILFCTSLSAQDDVINHPNALKISPFQLGSSQLELAYERILNNGKSSIQLMPSIYLKESSRESFSGFQLEAQYRFNIIDLRKGRNKTWIFSAVKFFGGPYLLGSMYTSEYQLGYTDEFGNYVFDQVTDDITSGEGGAILGLQLEIAKRILLEFTTGGGVRIPEVTSSITPLIDPNNYYNDPNIFDQKYKGVKPKVNFQIGFTF